MSVHFEPAWSWTLTLIACVAMLAVVWLGYPRRIQHVATPWRRMLIALRLAIVVVLCLLLLRPLVVFESQDQSDSILYILTDASRKTSDLRGSNQLSEKQCSETLRGDPSGESVVMSDSPPVLPQYYLSLMR